MGSSADQSIFNKIEQAQFASMLSEKQKIDLKIDWYAAAGDPKAKMNEPDERFEASGVKGVYAKGERAAMVDKAETENKRRLELWEKDKIDEGPEGAGEDGGKISPEEAVKQIKERINALAGGFQGLDNAAVGARMKEIHSNEAKFVREKVKITTGKEPKLLLIPRQSEDSWWIEVSINPKEVTTKWPKGTGGVETKNGKKTIGMFHGSLAQIPSAPEIDMDRLKGRRGDGTGLELGSGLYLSHYFHDVAGYVGQPNRKTKEREGYIHKFMVPEWILQQATKAVPNTNAGDAEWERAGDVVKGEWLHINSTGWKAGYQWCIKSKSIVEKLAMDVKTPYAAADAWGRGRQNEFPADFGGPQDESIDSARRLSAAGSSHNALEPAQPQIKGLSEG